MRRSGTSCDAEGGERGRRNEAETRRAVRGREGAGGVCGRVSPVGKGTEVDLLCFPSCWGAALTFVCLFFPVRILPPVGRGFWWGDGSGERWCKPL